MTPYRAKVTMQGATFECLVLDHDENNPRIYRLGIESKEVHAWGPEGMAWFAGGVFDCFVDAIEPIADHDADTVLYSEVAALDDTVMEP